MAELTTLVDVSDITSGDDINAEPLSNNFTAIANALSGDTASFNLVVSGDSTVDNIKTDGNTISSTNTNGDINISPNGSGKVKSYNIEFAGGSIDGVVIGGISPSPATVTTLLSDSIATDGKEALKMDVLSLAVSNGFRDSFIGTVGHGKGANLRGCLIPTMYVNAGSIATDWTWSANTARTGDVGAINITGSGTNSYFGGTLYVIVFYV